MSKFNTKKILLFTLIGVVLTGCGRTSSSEDDVPSENYYLAETGNYSNRALDDAIEMTALTSVGDQKILVVPVTFSNTISKATTEVHTMIEKVFFGSSEETGWESVASYYHKSSYGKISLSGEVLDYFNAPYTTSQFGALPVSEEQGYGSGYYWDQTHHLIEDIYDFYPASLLKEYDQDGDGHVDALWMVYIAEINALGGSSSNVDDPFWAYKFYWNRDPNTTKPTPNVYAWASYKFALEGNGYTSSLPDAHTFIHESGHLFGLPDYYDYDGTTSPAGGLDMMDNNIADHNMYTKYRLNWASPYVVTGTTDITLRPSESSGDFIILKDGWNGHAYDEYVVIEYFTPTGLSEKDKGPTGYASDLNPNGTRGFSIPGVRMYHVDSRLQTYVFSETTQELVSSEWSDEIIYDDWSYTAIATSNTSSRSVDTNFKTLHLLNAQGTTSKVGNWLKSATNAGNSALFQTGAVIGATDWKKYFQLLETFNDGTPVGYSVEIGEMNEDGVQIIITKAESLPLQ